MGIVLCMVGGGLIGYNVFGALEGDTDSFVYVLMGVSMLGVGFYF